jgi:hypothetical protein
MIVMHQERGRSSPSLKMEFAVPNFFAIKMRDVEIESVPETGRTYFLHRGQIVAVMLIRFPHKR